jgi:hypothetical protein
MSFPSFELLFELGKCITLECMLDFYGDARQQFLFNDSNFQKFFSKDKLPGIPAAYDTSEEAGTVADLANKKEKQNILSLVTSCFVAVWKIIKLFGISKSSSTTRTQYLSQIDQSIAFLIKTRGVWFQSQNKVLRRAERFLDSVNLDAGVFSQKFACDFPPLEPSKCTIQGKEYFKITDSDNCCWTPFVAFKTDGHRGGHEALRRALFCLLFLGPDHTLVCAQRTIFDLRYRKIGLVSVPDSLHREFIRKELGEKPLLAVKKRDVMALDEKKGVEVHHTDHSATDVTKRPEAGTVEKHQSKKQRRAASPVVVGTRDSPDGKTDSSPTADFPPRLKRLFSLLENFCSVPPGEQPLLSRLLVNAGPRKQKKQGAGFVLDKYLSFYKSATQQKVLVYFSQNLHEKKADEVLNQSQAFASTFLADDKSAVLHRTGLLLNHIVVSSMFRQYTTPNLLAAIRKKLQDWGEACKDSSFAQDMLYDARQVGTETSSQKGSAEAPPPEAPWVATYFALLSLNFPLDFSFLHPFICCVEQEAGGSKSPPAASLSSPADEFWGKGSAYLNRRLRDLDPTKVLIFSDVSRHCYRLLISKLSVLYGEEQKARLKKTLDVCLEKYYRARPGQKDDLWQNKYRYFRRTWTLPVVHILVNILPREKKSNKLIGLQMHRALIAALYGSFKVPVDKLLSIGDV